MISRIPDLNFVKCVNCKHRRKQRVLKKSGKGKETNYYCALVNPWRQLFGQRGCVEGKKRNEYKCLN